MSDINDIFERLKGQKPVISNPDELTDLIMDSLPDINEATEPTGARVVKMRRWMAAAASLIIIIGIGTIWMFDNEQPKPQRLTAHHSVVTPTPKVVADLKSTTKEYGELKSPSTKESDDLKTSVNTKVKTEEDKTEKQSHTAVISNLHYAVYTPEEDSAYQAPSRMVEFISKIADYPAVHDRDPVYPESGRGFLDLALHQMIDRLDLTPDSADFGFLSQAITPLVQISTVSK